MSQTTFPRWIPLLGGLLGSTTCGLLLYAFSIFINPLMKQFGWALAETQLAYAIICLVFGLMTFPAGRLADKYGPRTVVLIGGLIMATGFFLVSTIAPDSSVVAAGGDTLKSANRTALYLFYVYYGAIAGFGGGCVYLPPIATAPKWWPDRRALATGFTVVGLGLGSFIMPPIATKIMAQSGGSALPVFQYVGIAMGILVIISALCLKVPPAGWKPAGWNPPAPAGGAGAPKAYRDYTYDETKKTAQFWLLWVAYFCGSFAGLMVISLVAKHGVDAMSTVYMAANNLTDIKLIPKEIADSFTGLAKYAVMSLAVTNAAVRILIGPIIDKLGGTKKVFITLFTLQIAAMLVLFPAGKETMMLAACAALIGWNYGAIFTLFPATTLQYFGPSAQGSNYGLLFTAWGVAGFCGVFAGGWLKDATGTFLVPFVVSAVVLAVGLVILATLKAPEKKAA